MPQFWQKSFIRSSPRPANGSPFYAEGSQQHPDLPLPPGPRSHNISRSTSVSDRHYLENRRSIALFQAPNPIYAESPSNSVSPPPQAADSPFPPPRTASASGGIVRSQTVVYRDTQRYRDVEPIYEISGGALPSPLWSPNSSHLPTPNYEQEQELGQDLMPMNSGQGKISSDSGSVQTGLDRWSQRRLQRLNTEQGFREQRQGGGAATAGGSSSGGVSGSNNLLSPTISDHYPSSGSNNGQDYAQPQSQPQQQSYTAAKASLRPAINSNNSNSGIHSNHISPNYAPDPSHHQQQTQQPSQQFANNNNPPQDALTQYQARQAQQAASRNNSTNNSSTPPQDLETSMGSNNHISSNNTNNGGLGKVNAVGNRQSVHNALMSREGSNVSSQGGVPPQAAAAAFSQSSQQGMIDPRRNTPQALVNSEDMSEDDIGQLMKDHKELREKYTKVKKYYFEKEDQVKQLQNSLASQRLSQSRTSLDDSEYTTRFNRLDGLIAQLAFSIRKSWRSLPSWLANSVNKDAVMTGKQEMTAAGRAFISCWLVEEVFDKYFHPDLEPALSAQLKSVQRNIRRFAPQAQTAEEEDYLIAKIVNWRLATLEGLQDALRSPQCPTFRAQMTDMLKEHLCGALAVHLQDPPPSDLEGGVHMIVELVVSIAIHLPLESRDVVIEYYMPSTSILPDNMKIESGIPALTVSIADDAAERASMKSATSEIDNGDAHEQQGKKRGMLSALTGSGGKQRPAQSGQKQSASGSSSSLQRPESAQGKDETPRVRMAAGIGVSIRGRSVLVKAPVFST